MNPAQLLLLMYALVGAACVAAAIVALSIGFRLYRPAAAQAPTRPRRITGSVLMLSSLAWLGLAAYQQAGLDNRLAMLEIETMPATAAGIEPDGFRDERASAVDTASVATLAEELAADPRHPDFQQLRGKVTTMLYRAEQFGQYPHPILLTLPKDRDGETIRYLAEERPGLLTVIYHSSEGEEPRMLVYWPDVAGDQLIYTPLSGPSTQALSQLVRDALTK